MYMLCGLPGSGKSTWVDNHKHELRIDPKDIAVISTDDIIETIAHLHGMTYNEVFNDISYSFAEKISYQLAQKHFKTKKIIYWDQTNLTLKSRAKKLALVPEGWQKIAVNFNISNSVLRNRLEKRAKESGKTIPEHVINNMINSYVAPSNEEGFNNILLIPERIY